MAELAPGIPAEPVRDLLAWMRKCKVKGFLVGGLATALLGRPRFTRDVDCIVFLDEDRWGEFLEQGAAFSFRPRIADPLNFAAQRRVLLLRHSTTQLDFDLIIAGVPFEEQVLARATVVKVGRVSYPVPSPEDFVIMKAIANRPKDKDDIEGVLDCWPELDLAHIRRIVDEFAEVLEAPELRTDLEQALSRRPKQASKKKKRNR